MYLTYFHFYSSKIHLYSKPVKGLQGYGLSYRFAFNGQERDDEVYNTGRMYTAEYWEYDAALARRWNVDPEIAQKPDQSSYAVLSNNPIIMIDPLGNLETEFKDAEGNTTKTVEDGSNAVFQETGAENDKHYEFKGYNEKQGGKNEVNLTTAIQEQQNMNNTNPALQENSQGLGETHCNQATQCIMKTVSSTETDPNTKANAVVTGNANTMVTKLNTETNPNYQKVDQAKAEAHAKNGGLAVIGWKNPKGGHGHILTYSVGSNTKKGAVANIGPQKYSGFVSLNGAIAKPKPKTFYIYTPGKR